VKWILALFAFLCASAQGQSLRVEGLQFEEMGFPFDNRNVEVIWKLQTNRIPATMNIYRVVPAKFSVQFLTNLIAMGGFKEPEKVKNALVPALRGKDALWEEIPAHKTIGLSPERGKAQFFDTSRRAGPKERPHGVPSDEQALKLAMEAAKVLGISTNELAKEPDSGRPLIRRSKQTMGGLLDGKYSEREISRAVYLYRDFDGIPVYGSGNCGGLYVDFGNDARIASLDLSWRNLQVKTTRPTADRNQIAKWIKGGKAYFSNEDVKPEKVKKLTIHDMVAHYRGFPTDYHQSEVLPMVVIQATADSGAHIMLFCPIVEHE